MLPERKNKERIKTLEGLRALAFSAVLIQHASFMLRTGVLGYWAVSVFFVLQGFVAVYSQFDKQDLHPSFRHNFKYLFSRMKKIYPLHIATTLAMAIFLFTGSVTTPLREIILRLGLNAALIQEWLPLLNREINGVSWFLCTSAFFYLIFPCVLKLMQSPRASKKKAVLHLAILIAAEVLIGIVSSHLQPLASNQLLTFDPGISYWFVYSFPVSRVIDCLIGCELGHLFLCDRNKVIKKATLKEFIAVIISLLTIVLSAFWIIAEPVNRITAVFKSFSNLTYCAVYLPGTIAVVFLFAFGQGKISRLFTGKPFMYLAKLSMYGFLINWVVLDYINRVINFLLGSQAEIFLLRYGSLIKVTIGIFLTLAAAQVWIAITRFISGKRR